VGHLAARGRAVRVGNRERGYRAPMTPMHAYARERRDLAPRSARASHRAHSSESRSAGRGREGVGGYERHRDPGAAKRN
jgi:hypothetical protein